MNVPQARKTLEKLGFTFPREGKSPNGQLRWGTMQTDEKPLPRQSVISRDVFFTNLNKTGGFYVTSCLRVRHGKKPHQTHSTKNIFAHGKTLAGAIRQFCRNFKTRTYNESR